MASNRDTTQPNWKFIKNLGDENPLDYGGKFLFIDTTGVYPPELEILDVPDDENENIEYKVYRLCLEPHTYENAILSDNKFHKDHPVWYAKSIDAIVRYSGCGNIVDYLISDDPLKRASAYDDLISYFGLEEFDSYPLTLTREEAEKRIENYKETP